MSYNCESVLSSYMSVCVANCQPVYVRMCAFAFYRTPGCKLSCRLHMKAEDSGYTRRRGERREKQIGRRRRTASAFILNPAGEGLGLSLWERETASCCSTHTHAHAHDKNLGKENSRVPLKLNGKIISLLLTIIKKSIPYIQAVKNTWKAPTAKWVQKVLSNMKDFQLLVFKKKRPTERQSSYQSCQSRPAGQTISSLC